jgi:glyoxylase-like metal-dependent hydrolase (beta-lactamase superfamily II)
MDIQTPEYTVGRWANDGERMTFKGEQLNMTIYHTPGHTLDQVAIWDSDERVLFVGDTMYEYAHILFPLEGSIPLYSDSIGKLKNLVRGWNAEASQRVKMACGHNTRAADAETLLNEVDEMLYGVMMKKFKEIDRGEERDQQQVSFQRDDLKIKFFGPKQYFEDFRDIPAAMQSLADRQSKTET